MRTESWYGSYGAGHTRINKDLHKKPSNNGTVKWHQSMKPAEINELMLKAGWISEDYAARGMRRIDVVRAVGW